jgi:hypothetical protein
MSYGEEYHGEQARVRHGSPTFYKLLDEMARTHDSKSHDYASDSNPSGNYHFAGQMALLFSHSSQDAGFWGRIAEKVYRLANLESSGKQGITETLEDTERDCATIMALWMADRRNRRMSTVNQACDKLRSPEEERSEAAACQMISLTQQLTPSDLKQMRDYLSACIRDEPKR